MEKTNWSKILMESFLPVLLTVLITSGAAFLINNDSCTIYIGTSIENHKETYLTPITISNKNKNKSVKEFEVSVGVFNSITNVNSNFSYKYENNILTLDYIPPKETISIIVETVKNIENDDVKISYNGNVSMNYLNKNNSMFVILLITSVLQFSILFISQYIFDKKMKIINENIESVKNEASKTDMKIDELNEERIKLKEESKNNRTLLKMENYKIKLYYLSRMRDYAKELNFWKDTIRKFVYHSNLNGDKIELLFDTVTDTLNTYGTRSKSDTNYNEIEYLAMMMNNTEINNIEEFNC